MRRLAALLVALAVTGCGSPGGHTGERVSVLYAGSLVTMMEHDLGPAFAKASGVRYRGYGAGSSQLASEINGKLRRGDVFISASPKVNADVHGVRWYATFATAPLVLGYNPKSRYARDLRTKPWYEAIAEPGIKVGRTDPKLDPKGKLTAEALARAHVSAKTAVFPEEVLVGRLQSGQLDAGFFYANEAAEQHIPTVHLGRIHLAATYTVTTLTDRGVVFVKYLLGPNGREILTGHGLTVLTPSVSGTKSAVPRGLRSALGLS